MTAQMYPEKKSRRKQTSRREEVQRKFYKRMGTLRTGLKNRGLSVDSSKQAFKMRADVLRLRVLMQEERSFKCEPRD